MNTFFKIQLSLFVLLLWFSALSMRVDACLLTHPPEGPRAAVRSDTYILVGEVIGYTEPVTNPKSFRGAAVGVRLKPVESIHFPYHQNDYVEVFMFRHGPDCFPVARDDTPKLGSHLRLVLQPASLIANRSGSHVRLDSNVFSRIANDESMFGFSTKADSVFDYKRDLRPLADKFAPGEMADKRPWLEDFIYIETSKDLLRLHRAATKQQRMEVLERLLYAPGIDYGRLLASKLHKPAEGYATGLPPPDYTDPTTRYFKKLSKKEQQLLKERMRLEYSGDLNLGKNWITH